MWLLWFMAGGTIGFLCAACLSAHRTRAVEYREQRLLELFERQARLINEYGSTRLVEDSTRLMANYLEDAKR